MNDARVRSRIRFTEPRPIRREREPVTHVINGRVMAFAIDEDRERSRKSGLNPGYR